MIAIQNTILVRAGILLAAVTVLGVLLAGALS